jgi:Tol biopolymer transport system component
MASTHLIGAKLGRYEIRSQLGAGGMGEVYRARDTQLGRDVAVKVLPTTVSTDPDRLRRFEQEACAASALNHPNILIVHDIGAHDGTTYVVSELLEGETLRKRIGGTPLGQRRAIDYALQIANGLAAAHEKGIIHRDLKPDNVFITNDGRVKILDFGLAKLTQLDGNQPQTDVPTRRVETDPGVVMGTVGYMSPEQLKGGPVDQRTDIFSFGAIFYEMLSGRRAFHGGSAAETMSAVLREDPPELSDTNKNVSPALERLVNHCLEKNSEGRFHSARDVAFALEALGGSSSTSGQTIAMSVPTTSRVKPRELIAWIVAGVAVLGAILLLIIYRQRAPVDAHAVRFTIAAPRGIFGGVSISPDGRRLAFIGVDSSGKRHLFLRPLDSLTAQELPETEGAAGPFWSPDSRFVGFFAEGKLKKIDTAGGPPQTITTVQNNVGATWNRDGVIVFAPGISDGLSRISVAGGEVTTLTTLDKDREDSHRWPRFLPDGRHLLYFSRQRAPHKSGIYVSSLDSKDSKRILETDYNAMYAPPGYLLFVRESALMAQPFDADKLELTGEAFPVAEQVGVNAASRVSHFTVSENGVLVYDSGGETVASQLAWHDRAGKQTSTVGGPGNNASLGLSPDEKKVAVERVEKGSGDIWLIDMDRNTETRFTFDPAFDLAPIWSPDGTQILFASVRNGPPSLYMKPASGSSNEDLLLNKRRAGIATDWSADGKFILYREINDKSKFDLWILPLEGDRTPKPFLQDDFDKGGAKFSPDGKWVAYYSDESGQYQVYVQPFPGPGGKYQVSSSGGINPVWRRDGKELFYVASDGKLMAVKVKEGSGFEAVSAKPLFDTRVRGTGILGISSRDNYAVSRDGQRFLMNDRTDVSTAPPLTVVLNWTADLKR